MMQPTGAFRRLQQAILADGATMTAGQRQTALLACVLGVALVVLGQPGRLAPPAAATRGSDADLPGAAPVVSAPASASPSGPESVEVGIGSDISPDSTLAPSSGQGGVQAAPGSAPETSPPEPTSPTTSVPPPERAPPPACAADSSFPVPAAALAYAILLSFEHMSGGTPVSPSATVGPTLGCRGEPPDSPLPTLPGRAPLGAQPTDSVVGRSAAS